MFPQASRDQYLALQRLTVATLLLVRREWAKMGGDFDASWARLGPRIALLTASAQLGAARTGIAYIDRVLTELNVDAPADGAVSAVALAGIASDGRPLDSLLTGAVTTAKSQVGNGFPVSTALAAGGSWLDMAVHTQVADADRNGAGVAIAARPAITGYVRMLNPPSCPRCAVLAGKFYRWNTGFQRHPRCDCTHIPASENVAGDFRTDPFEAIKAGQVTGLSKADTRAILDDGADPSKVINTHRSGMPYSVDGVKFTREAAGRKPRLMPESIYQKATSREDAIRLLRSNGYLT